MVSNCQMWWSPDMAKRTVPPPAPEGYGDVFADADQIQRTPMTVLDGTSLRFPSSWTRNNAKTWRSNRGFEKPNASRTQSRS